MDLFSSLTLDATAACDFCETQKIFSLQFLYNSHEGVLDFKIFGPMENES